MERPAAQARGPRSTNGTSACALSPLPATGRPKSTPLVEGTWHCFWNVVRTVLYWLSCCPLSNKTKSETEPRRQAETCDHEVTGAAGRPLQSIVFPKAMDEASLACSMTHKI